MDTTKVYEFPIREHWRQPRALLGAGAAELAGPEAATMGLKHVLFVTSGLRGTGIVDEVRGSFEDSGVAVTVYDGVESNPKDYNVMDAYQAFAQAECDGFVSLGGGSSHDTAKGARIVAAHDGRNVNDFAGLNVSERLDNPPQIAINTTVGTGSETTPAYVITDTTSDNAPYKWVGFDKACTTTLAINDPVLMLTQPAEYVAYTGFDTMAHASECYTNRVQMHSATPAVAASGGARRGQPAPGVRQPARHRRDDEHDVGPVHGRAGVLVGAARDHPLALARRLRVVRRPPRPQQRRRHRPRVDLQPPRVPGPLRRHRPTRCMRPSPACPGREGRRRRDRGGHPPRARLRIPENCSTAQEYPKTPIGQGWYESRPAKIEPDDAELEKMAAHMLADICTPGNPRQVTLETCKEILRDCAFDSMDCKAGGAWTAAPTTVGGRGTLPPLGMTRRRRGASGVVEARRR